LRLRELVVKKVTVCKFRVNDGGGNGTGCCGIEVKADTTVDKCDNSEEMKCGHLCTQIFVGQMLFLMPCQLFPSTDFR